MEILNEERISIRYSLIENLDYYIDESVYYRSFSDEIKNFKKHILYNTKNNSGKITIK